MKPDALILHPRWPQVNGFVEGHGFSRADQARNNAGFSPWVNCPIMRNANAPSNSMGLLLAALTALFLFGGQVHGQAEKDPHRPTCTSPSCRTVRSFVKAHYCGAPEGNGPNDSCDIRRPKSHGPGIKVDAAFECKWIDGIRKCKQHGQPSSEVHNILMGELRRLGLPAKAKGQIYFNVSESPTSGLTLASADYDRSAGNDLWLSQVIVTIDQSLQVAVLRKVRFQKTDVDKPTVTTWSPIDLADVDGSGHIAVVLEGDACEDHWLEVVSVQNGSSRTLFSGLGYYL